LGVALLNVKAASRGGWGAGVFNLNVTFLNFDVAPAPDTREATDAAFCFWEARGVLWRFVTFKRAKEL